MDERLLRNAEEMRVSITQGAISPAQFQAAFLEIPGLDRDAWVDAVFGLDELPDDGAELPQGCVPYLPCGVDALLRIANGLPVRADDVFVDVGAGIGRAAVWMHLFTGARAIGIEVQSGHVHRARQLVQRMGLSKTTFVHGDALHEAESLAQGTVFFLYCPFSGERLGRFLEQLRMIAREKPISVCAVDLPLPKFSWLEPVGPVFGDVEMYQVKPEAQTTSSFRT